MDRLTHQLATRLEIGLIHRPGAIVAMTPCGLLPMCASYTTMSPRVMRLLRAPKWPGQNRKIGDLQIVFTAGNVKIDARRADDGPHGRDERVELVRRRCPIPMRCSAASTSTMRSIVLAPSAGGPELGVLRASLAARSWEAVLVHEAGEALAELAAVERSQRSRSNWGLRRTVTAAMVIVRPESWPRVDELCNAVGQYFPAVNVWSFAAGRLEVLQGEEEEQGIEGSRDRGIEGSRHEGTKARSDEATERRSDSERKTQDPAPLLITQHPRNSALSERIEVQGCFDDVSDDAVQESSTITREELDMLLEVSPENGST